MYQIRTDRGTNVHRQCAKYVALLVQNVPTHFARDTQIKYSHYPRLVSELHDITGNPPHHQNLGKTSDASVTRIDSTREMSSPVFAINLDSQPANYNKPYCTMTHLDRAPEIPFVATSTRHWETSSFILLVL